MERTQSGRPSASQERLKKQPLGNLAVGLQPLEAKRMARLLLKLCGLAFCYSSASTLFSGGLSEKA